MPRTKKKNKKPGRAARIALRIGAGILAALGLFLGFGMVNSSVVRVRRADVVLEDLPERFDGLRILYASDIDLIGPGAAAKATALFDQLQALKPDLLLLGGGYTADSLLEALNRSGDAARPSSQQLKEREDFFQYIGRFDAPLGVYAIAAPEDGDAKALEALMKSCGVQPLINDRAALRLGEDTLWLAGLCERGSGLSAAGDAFRGDDCVILAAYSPTLLPTVLTGEARDGGPWADLTLCGHTHGGQVRLLGRSALDLDIQEQRYLSGWHIEAGQLILITTGVGCRGMNIRIGSSPEVWLLTLTSGGEAHL